MLRLTLIRHAATPFTEAGRYQGHRDVELSAGGVRQARALGPVLAAHGIAPAEVWTSDLLRARRTAELALPGVRLRPDPRLRELAFGDCEGFTFDENRERLGTRFLRWVEDPERHAPPGGESVAGLRERLLEWLNELPPSGDVLAVTHGGPIRVVAAWHLGLASARELRIHLPPCTVVRTVLDREGGP